jgi:hypothetical protein
LPVLDNLDRHDTPGFGEEGFEFRFGGLVREVGYVDFLVHISSFDISAWVKHSTHSSFLSLGAGTGVMTSFPQPEHTIL